MSDEELLSTRCNSEPNIFKGCSSSELVALAIFSVLFWFPVGIIVWLVIGSFPTGAGFAIGGILFTLFTVPGVFQRIKRGRPDGHYQVMLNIHLGRFKLLRVLGFNNDYIRTTGQWDIGRTY